MTPLQASEVGSAEAGEPLELVVELCRRLSEAGVSYCHWKSNEAIDRSASGENDLDLLIARPDAQRFDRTLADLGFKAARPTASREVPGLIDHYGVDGPSGRFVHVQAHYQLVLGDDMTKNFRIPIEHLYLRSARRDGLFPLPAPELELAVFVVRMVLKHASLDAQLCLQGRLSASERRELSHLLDLVPDARASVVAALPLLSEEVLGRCFDVVCENPSPLERAAVARALEAEMAALSRRSRSADVVLRIGRRGVRAFSHVVGPPARKRLIAGGAVIAFAGDDHAARRRMAEATVTWLGAVLDVRDHGVLDGADAAGAGRARRDAANGRVVICEVISAEAGLAGSVDLVVDVGSRGGGPSESGLFQIDTDVPWEEAFASTRGAVWSRL